MDYDAHWLRSSEANYRHVDTSFSKEGDDESNQLANSQVFLGVDDRGHRPPVHCMTVSLALDGAGLGTVWGEQLALEMLDDAGFTLVEVERLDAEPLNNFYVARKG